MIFPARNLNNMSVAKEFLGPWSGCSWRRRLGRYGHLDVSGFDWMVNVLVAGSWFPIYAIFPGKPGVVGNTMVFHHGEPYGSMASCGLKLPRRWWLGRRRREKSCAAVLCFLSRQEVLCTSPSRPGDWGWEDTPCTRLSTVRGDFWGQPSNLAVGTPMVCLILNRGT